MNDQTFSLIPFGKDSTLPDLEVIGTIARRDPFLLIQFTLLGAVDQVLDLPQFSQAIAEFDARARVGSETL